MTSANGRLPDRFVRRWLALAPNARGAAWVLAAAAMFAGMSVLIKLAGQGLSSFEIAFFRAFIGLLAILPFVVGQWRTTLATRRPLMHVVRGTVGSAGMLCGFYSFTELPLADAVSISFAQPLFLIVLAVLVLKETVRIRRWSATAVGFIGVLIIVRPTGAIEPATAVALAGAAFTAGVAVMLRLLSATENARTILFFYGAFSTLASLLPAMFVWRWPTGDEYVLLVGIGLLGTLGNLCILRGVTLGEPTAVMPFDYARLLMTGVLAYWIFAEVPDAWTFVGAIIIIGANLYIARREARLGRQRPAGEIA